MGFFDEGEKRMDKFTIIYKILKTLEKAMSVEEFDPAVISPERLRINETL